MQNEHPADSSRLAEPNSLIARLRSLEMSRKRRRRRFLLAAYLVANLFAIASCFLLQRTGKAVGVVTLFGLLIGGCVAWMVSAHDRLSRSSDPETGSVQFPTND